MRKSRSLRHPHTTQELRKNCWMRDPEAEDKLFRLKRSNKNLPTVYDDLWIRNGKSWKDATKRKKQYRINKSEFKEIYFNATSIEQFDEFYFKLKRKGVYFKFKMKWWSLPAIDREIYIYWWE